MADDTARQGPQTVTFLQALFGSAAPSGTRIALWQKQTKQSTYLTRPEAAADMHGETDVYVSAGLAPHDMSDARRRIKARECAGIPGVWIDVDINGGPTVKDDRAPDRDAALALSRIELTPTLLVASGYGLQAWWLFDDPWLFSDDAEREQAARICKGWEVLHRNHARRYGYGLDRCADLARLMRLPGTFNGKGEGDPDWPPAPVEIVDLDGPRYGMERLADSALTVAPMTSVSVRVNPDGGFPKAKFDALYENHDFFRKTWDHRRKDRSAEGWSMSEYDMALTSMAAARNWTDDELAALIREHRVKQGDPLKGRRQDYLERTIARARTQIQQAEQIRVRQEALEDIDRHRAQGTLTGDVAYSKFNQALGANDEEAIPPVKELIQYSDDPDEARWVMSFADGQEANIGSTRNLRTFRELELRLIPVIGYCPLRMKDDEWRRALNALLRYRTVREEPELQILAWIRQYVAERLTSDVDEAAKVGEPFERDGMMYLRAEGLARFAKVSLKERVRTADLWPLLRRANFEPTTVHHSKLNGSGGQTTSHYWRAALADLNLG